MRLHLDKMKCPPLWQTFFRGLGLIQLVNMLLKAGTLGRVFDVIDGSNQPSETAPPTRVTVVVVAPISIGRWMHWFGYRHVFFLMVDVPKEEDPTIGDLLRLLHGVSLYVHTGDTKEGEITIGAGVAAKNGCRVTFFSKARNSPKKTNEEVQMFHKQLQKDIGPSSGCVMFLGDCPTTPKEATSPLSKR